MFSPRSFIKKFQIKKKKPENETQVSKETKKDKSIKYDSDESIRSALVEIFIYIIFLVVTTIVANAAHHLYMFYFNQTLERSFLGRTSLTKFGSEISFDQLVTTADWWIYLETNFLNDLHGGVYEAGNTVAEDETNTSDISPDHTEKSDNESEEETETERQQGSRAYDKEKSAYHKLKRLYLRDNILLGPPRLRQIRVEENTCLIHDVFLTYFNSCYAAYSKDIEYSSKVYKGTQFYTMSELKVNPVRGEIATYYGAGYVQKLSFNLTENQKSLELLKERKWIDRGTRIVILEFVLFNVNAFMFDNVKIIAEIPPVGGIVPSHQFQALKFDSIWTEGDVGLYIAGGIYYIMVVFYTIEEIVQCIKIGVKKYILSVWNILDNIVLIFSYLSFIYNIIHPLYLDNVLKNAEANTNDFVSIDYICYWNLLYIDMMGICVFLVWIKIFKYISFNKTLLQFSTTLKRCAKDLFGFSVMFFIVFLAYAQLGLLIFGTSHPDFREFGISVITLMRMFLGDFEYQLIEEANHVLGPIYFLTYVLFVFFILLNMFLAIINDTYGAVKSEVTEGHSKLGSYLVNGFRKICPMFFPKHTRKSETDNSTTLTEIVDNATKDNKHGTSNITAYPTTSSVSKELPSLERVRKRESEILREYFEELPENQNHINGSQIPRENYELQRLNNRITLLEEVLEQLVTNMDRILKKVESAKTKRN